MLSVKIKYSLFVRRARQFPYVSISVVYVVRPELTPASSREFVSFDARVRTVRAIPVSASKCGPCYHAFMTTTKLLATNVRWNATATEREKISVGACELRNESKVLELCQRHKSIKHSIPTTVESSFWRHARSSPAYAIASKNVTFTAETKAGRRNTVCSRLYLLRIGARLFAIICIVQQVWCVCMYAPHNTQCMYQCHSYGLIMSTRKMYVIGLTEPKIA